MKKLLLTITAALAALAAPAVTLDLGPWNNPSTTEGDTYALPLNWNHKFSASQVLLTNEQLTEIVPKVDAAGTTYAAIKSVSFKFSVYPIYYTEGSCTVKAYCQNVDVSSFPIKNGYEQYLPYQDGVVGTAILEELDEELLYGGGNCTITITFTEPIKYEGNSLLLTFFTENGLTWNEDFGEYFYEGACTYNPGDASGIKHSGGLNADAAMPTLTGNLANSSVQTPVMQFEYEEVTEANGPTVTEGDPTTTMIGTIDETQGGSKAGTNQPVAPAYQHSASQAIYTSLDLRALGVDGNTTKAKIDEITFWLPTEYENYTQTDSPEFSLTLYVNNSDATTFNKQGTDYVFFPYKDGIKGTATINAETNDTWEDFICYGGYGSEDGRMYATVKLDEPIIYEGQSLILTWFCESSMNDLYWNASTVGFTTDGVQSVQKYSISSVPSMEGTFRSSTETSVEKFVPTLSFHYTPLTISGGTKTPVIISYEGASLSKCVTAKGNANNISVAFSIDDPAGCESYEIKLGTTSLGTVTATEGTVNFLAEPKADLLLSVVPAGENVVGSSVTIPAADIAALFTTPVIDGTVATALHGTYDPIRSTAMDLDAAASIHMTTTVPVALVNFLGSGASMVYPEGGQDAEFFKQLVPEGLDNSNANSFEAADGVFAFYKNKAFKSDVTAGFPALEALSGSLSVKPVARYPIAAAAVPALSATVPSAVTIANKDVPVASAFRVDFTADALTEINIESSLSRIDYTFKDGYFIAVIPEGHTMEYCIVGAPAAKAASISLLADTADDDLDWTASDDRVLSLAHADIAGADIHIRALNDEGTERHRVDLHIDEAGNISGVSDITADGSDAEAEYYDLSGRRVASPAARGIYIRRTATTVAKVAL